MLNFETTNRLRDALGQKGSWLIVFSGVVISGCSYNGNFNKAAINALTSSTSTTATPTTPSFRISNVTILSSTSTGATSATPAVTLYFDSTTLTTPLSTYCSVGQTGGTTVSNPCACLFSWQEINQTSGVSVAVPRTVRTSVTKVQSALAACDAPQVYTGEILEGTTIRISVVPDSGNGSNFTMTPYNFVKTNGAIAGSFQDSQGRSFDNILHYSCYEQFKRGMDVKNLKFPLQNAAGQTSQMAMASKFCVQKIKGGGEAKPGCENLAQVDNTAQSYYYNLYIRDSERGDINLSNDRYTCPQVREALASNGTLGTQGLVYPLDSTFALSLGKTNDFQVGIEAFTKLSNGADPTAVNSGCSGSSTSTGTTGNSNTFIRSCLGFASKPSSDGTCPYFRDANNLIRPTFRLRKYVAIYPPIFDSNGNFLKEAQAMDVAFVLARPANSPTADPLKPFTIRGPKPCPYAFFDKKGVTGLVDAGYTNTGGFRPRYLGTDNMDWTGTNVDGIQFPNFDDGPNSCAAVFPLLNDTGTMFTLGTLFELTPGSANRNPGISKTKPGRQYIRPIQAFTPHYEEDLDFQACAPQATPLRDPPLHFARDNTTGNVSWCAENYPTQNDNIPQLEFRTTPSTAYVGNVRPFTSHGTKHSASNSCVATVPLSTPTSVAVYPATGQALHPNIIATLYQIDSSD
ncbi:MAG: hypothetical protein AABZ55_09515, partial [Bdellovibrionota bacterium]